MSEKINTTALIAIHDESLADFIKNILDQLGYGELRGLSQSEGPFDLLNEHATAPLLLDWAQAATVKCLDQSKGTSYYDKRAIFLFVTELTPESEYLPILTEYKISTVLVYPLTVDTACNIITAILSKNSVQSRFHNILLDISASYENKNYAAGVNTLLGLITEHTDNLRYMTDIAYGYMSLKEWDKALKWIHEIHAQSDEFPLASYLGFLCYEAKEEPQKALEYLKQSTQKNPYKIDRLISLGNFKLRKLELLGAQDSYEKVIAIDKKNFMAISGLIASFLLSADKKNALNWLAKIKSPEGKSISIERALITAISFEKHTLANSIFIMTAEILIENSILGRMAYNMALSAFKRENIVKGSEYLDLCLQYTPTNAEAKKLKDQLGAKLQLG